MLLLVQVRIPIKVSADQSARQPLALPPLVHTVFSKSQHSSQQNIFDHRKDSVRMTTQFESLPSHNKSARLSDLPSEIIAMIGESCGTIFLQQLHFQPLTTLGSSLDAYVLSSPHTPLSFVVDLRIFAGGRSQGTIASQVPSRICIRSVLACRSSKDAILGIRY